MTAYRILIADDEEDILSLLEYNLKKEGYIIEKAQNGQEVLEKAASFSPNLILLDVMMPLMDGVEACRRLRSKTEYDNTSILFLTARMEEYAEVAGFEAGADDYIIKPIKPRVLMSRIKAALKRNQKQPETTEIQVGELIVLPQSYLVKKNGVELQLSRKEFELLHLLISKPGRIFRRNEILEKVWNDVYVVERTVDVHIAKIREKIGEQYIQTLKGVGYKFLSE